MGSCPSFSPHAGFRKLFDDKDSVAVRSSTTLLAPAKYRFSSFTPQALCFAFSVFGLLLLTRTLPMRHLRL
jgi:hypothetical protein